MFLRRVTCQARCEKISTLSGSIPPAPESPAPDRGPVKLLILHWRQPPNSATLRVKRQRSRRASQPVKPGQTNPTKRRRRSLSPLALKIGGKVRYRPHATPLPIIAIPVFGHKSHISIDRRFGFIQESAVTSATEADGRQLKHVVSTDNTGSYVWADSAYRSKKNEKLPSDQSDRTGQKCYRKSHAQPPLTTLLVKSVARRTREKWPQLR